MGQGQMPIESQCRSFYLMTLVMFTLFIVLQYNVTCKFIKPPQILYTSHRGPAVDMSYGLAPLLQQLGLDTERIIVPSSSKDVNRMAYLAHVVRVG